jgi:uncharacterized membrane protein YidH (DUF202 family)
VSVPSDHTAHVERTVLAWRRTGLALFALALAAAKAADVSEAGFVAFVGVFVSLGTLAVVLASERRVSTGQATPAWTMLASSAALAFLVALVGVLLALTA